MAKYNSKQKYWTNAQKKESGKNEEVPVEPMDTNFKDNKKKTPILSFGGRHKDRGSYG